MVNIWEQPSEVKKNNEKKFSDSTEKRERVDRLTETDNSYEDSVYDLAEVEHAFREDLKNEGIAGKTVDRLADKFSDETLRRMEADKERWIDSLTGLRSKNAYREEVPQLLSMEKRSKNNCALLMIDFDHFKEVNDKFGHLAGDQILKKIADLIRNQVRVSDVVYRFGGEEFVIFLPNTNSSSAQDLAEKIRKVVRNSNLEIVGEKEEKIILNRTLSIGVVGTDQLSSWDKEDEKNMANVLEEMATRADSAVYASKEGGRDRVTLYRENLEKKERSNKK